MTQLYTKVSTKLSHLFWNGGSSNKEKVALLINRKQGENYHMRPIKTRHTGFSVIVTIAVRAREVYISRGLLSEAQRHNVRERNQLTDYD